MQYSEEINKMMYMLHTLEKDGNIFKINSLQNFDQKKFEQGLNKDDLFKAQKSFTLIKAIRRQYCLLKVRFSMRDTINRKELC